MQATPAAPARRGRLLVFNLVGLAAIVLLAGLGTWQLQRRAWKLDLIARVEARVHAAPAAAPGPAAWPELSAERDGYRRVEASGRFVEDRTTFVQAVTDFGGGFWALTPLRTDAGFTVLINRGFVPPDRRDPAGWRPPGGREQGQEEGRKPVTVTGLLRPSEPGGAFLRSNDPAAGRWYSRDTAAIARARGLDRDDPVAPYFIDAEREPGERGYPVAGLTVVAFPNNHLIYAITWFTVMAMAILGLGLVNRDAVRASRPGRGRA